MHLFNIQAIDEQTGEQIEVCKLSFGETRSLHLLKSCATSREEKSISYLINADIRNLGKTKCIRLLLDTDELFLVDGNVGSRGKKFKISDSKDSDLIKLRLYKAQLEEYKTETLAGVSKDIEMYNLVNEKIVELEKKVQQS